MTPERPGGEAEERGTAPDPAVLAIAVCLAAMAAAILFMVFTAPKVATYARIGPQAVPFVVGLCLCALSAATVWSAFANGRPRREPILYPPLLWIVGGLAAQMLTLKLLGFSVATGLLFAATARAFGRGPLWLTIPVGVALSFVIWLVFARGLRLSLPAGPLERFVLQLFS